MGVYQVTILDGGVDVTGDVTATADAGTSDIALWHDGEVCAVIREGVVQQFAPGHSVPPAGTVVETASVGVAEPA